MKDRLIDTVSVFWERENMSVKCDDGSPDQHLKQNTYIETALSSILKPSLRSYTSNS